MLGTPPLELVIGNLLYVEWYDSAGCSSNWSELKEDMELGKVVCKSVGWLINQSDHAILLAPHKIDKVTDRIENQYCGDMTIPKCSIVVAHILIEDLLETAKC